MIALIIILLLVGWLAHRTLTTPQTRRPTTFTTKSTAALIAEAFSLSAPSTAATATTRSSLKYKEQEEESGTTTRSNYNSNTERQRRGGGGNDKSDDVSVQDRYKLVKGQAAALPPSLVTVGEASGVNNIPISAQILASPQQKRWQLQQQQASSQHYSSQLHQHHTPGSISFSSHHSPSMYSNATTATSFGSDHIFSSPSGVAGGAGMSSGSFGMMSPLNRSQNVSPVPQQLLQRKGAMNMKYDITNGVGLSSGAAAAATGSWGDHYQQQQQQQQQDQGTIGRKGGKRTPKRPMGPIVMGGIEARLTQNYEDARAREQALSPLEGDSYSPFAADYAAGRTPFPSEVVAEHFRSEMTGANHPQFVFVQLPAGAGVVAPPQKAR